MSSWYSLIKAWARPIAFTACVFVFPTLHTSTIARQQAAGVFTATGDMTVARSGHSATLLSDGRVLIAGGAVSDESILDSTELYDPDTGRFDRAAAMSTVRRMHTATLLPDDRVLIVGGYGRSGATASAELFDPVSGTFSATGRLITPRGGHSAILLATGKVLIVGGYDFRAYPNVAPAELYDPLSGTFAPAGRYVGRDGCDFCAPSVLLADGNVLFPGQYPAQLYEPAADVFTALPMMLHDQSEAALLPNGQILFAGGSGMARIADTELYLPAAHTFVSTGSMSAPRVWHTLTPLANGTVLAAGGETDFCAGSACWFGGSVASAELYDPAAAAFVAAGNMIGPREVHSATLLKDGRVLLAGGVSYGGIGIFRGSLASAELYSPVVAIAAPALVALSGDGGGQGAIFHAGSRDPVNPDDPATAGESVDIHCRGLTADSIVPPQVAVGGRLAAVLTLSASPDAAGVTVVRVRIPSGIAAGSAVRVRLTYLGRPSNAVTMSVR